MYESCRSKDFHAHHPCDCLFYLCNESVENLPRLLTENNHYVEFDTAVSKETDAVQNGEAGMLYVIVA